MTSPPRRSNQFSWWGMIILLTGVGLLAVYFNRPALWSSPPLTRVFYLGMGGLLTFWGLRAWIGDLWPALNRVKSEGWSGYRVRMPREAAIFLGILIMLFLGALLGRSNMLVLVFGLLAGPFILNGSITLNMLRGTKAQRVLPDHVMAGQVFSVDLTLANSKRLISSWMMEVHDSLRSRFEHLEPAVLFTRVPPRSARTGSYQARLAHRGVYEVGPLQISSRFPLGLMERVIEMGGVQRLLVYPQIGRLLPAWHHALSFNNQLVEQPRTRKGSFDDEFHQLREYRSGDNPRAIHWRTTARRRTLMVRDFHQNRDQDILLALDLWLPERPSPADLELVEQAISFVATVCVEHCGRAGDSNLWLGIAGLETAEWEGQAGPAALESVLERLAIAEGSDRANLADVLVQLGERAEGPARRILVTTRPDSGVSSHVPATDLLIVSAETALAEFFEKDAV